MLMFIHAFFLDIKVRDETEDYVLLNHPKFKKQIEQAYKDSLEGKGIPLDELIEETKKELKEKI